MNKCEKCKEGILEVVSANEPYSPEHLQCNKCDSTYPIEVAKEHLENMSDWFYNKIILRLLVCDNYPKKPGAWIQRWIREEDREKLKQLKSDDLKKMRIK